jgi:hypothetical protein
MCVWGGTWALRGPAAAALLGLAPDGASQQQQQQVPAATRAVHAPPSTSVPRPRPRSAHALLAPHPFEPPTPAGRPQRGPAGGAARAAAGRGRRGHPAQGV